MDLQRQGGRYADPVEVVGRWVFVQEVSPQGQLIGPQFQWRTTETVFSTWPYDRCYINPASAIYPSGTALLDIGEQPPAVLPPIVTPAAAERDPPKGGLTAWLQVLAAGLLFFNTWGSAVSFGVFQTYYQEVLLPNSTPSDISWIGTTQTTLLCLVGVVSGPLYDRGYLRILVLSGSFLTVLGYMMASLARSYITAFMSLGIAVGLGAGCLFAPSIGASMAYFEPKKVPFVVGVSATGTCVGGVVYPIVFRIVVDQAGYAWACRAMGLISLATLALSFLLLRPRPASGPRKLMDASALREPPFLLYGLAMAAYFLALYVPYYYIPQFAQSRLGASDSTAFFLLAVQNGASAPGRFLPGLVAMRFGALQTTLAASIACAALTFAWIGLRSLPAVVVFVILYGNVAGAVISLNAACVAALSPNKTLVGTRIGMNAAIYAVGLLVGNPIAGAILRGPTGFTGQAIFAGCMLVVGSVITGLAIVLQKGIRVSVKIFRETGKRPTNFDLDSLYAVDEPDSR